MNSTARYSKVRLEKELSVLRVSAGQVGKASEADPLEKAKGRNPPHPTLTTGTETQSQRSSPFLGLAHPIGWMPTRPARPRATDLREDDLDDEECTGHQCGDLPRGGRDKQTEQRRSLGSKSSSIPSHEPAPPGPESCQESGILPQSPTSAGAAARHSPGAVRRSGRRPGPGRGVGEPSQAATGPTPAEGWPPLQPAPPGSPRLPQAVCTPQQRMAEAKPVLLWGLHVTSLDGGLVFPSHLGLSESGTSFGNRLEYRGLPDQIRMRAAGRRKSSQRPLSLLPLCPQDLQGHSQRGQRRKF